jgi:hypothetical protein
MEFSLTLSKNNFRPIYLKLTSMRELSDKLQKNIDKVIHNWEAEKVLNQKRLGKVKLRR